MKGLSLDDLGKTYPGAAAPALRGLTLDVAEGSMTALLGPSGCGKTTALKLIAGLLAPDTGAIRIDGRPVLNLPPEARDAVLMFQSPLLFPYQSVAENVGFGLRMRHRPKAEIARKVTEMLDLVRLPDLGDRRPAELSGGQQQRVALARALVVAPRLLLLDEPLTALDPDLRTEMRELIRQVQRELRITTLLVTHDQEEAAALADRVALLLGGRLRQHAPPEEIHRHPADADVARFFGHRGFLPGRSDGSLFDCALGPLHLPPGAATGAALLTIRPEAVALGAGPVNTLRVRVVERLFLGRRVRLRLAADHAEIEAIATPDATLGLAPGQPIDIHLPPAALWLVPGTDAPPPAS